MAERRSCCDASTRIIAKDTLLNFESYVRKEKRNIPSANRGLQRADLESGLVDPLESIAGSCGGSMVGPICLHRSPHSVYRAV